MTDIFNSSDYKKSRGFYSAQCAFEYFISILAADAFLAKLLKDIGLSDALTGVLSSLISVTFMFQLISIPLAGKLKTVKKPIIILDTLSQLFFASLYIVPFLPLGLTGKTITVTGLILLGYLALYSNNNLCYKWGNSFVSPDKRGSFSATKEMISLLSGVFFTLGAGFITDRYEAQGNLHGAFIFLAVAMVVICGFNFICLANMKEKPLSESGANQSTREIINRTFKNKNCRNAMILTAITDFARYMTLGFMGTYKTIDLGFSVSTIQVFNVAACMGRFAISKPLGRYSDKNGFSKGYYLGNIITVVSFVIGIFTSFKTRWLILPFTMLFQMSYAGTNQNTYNMMYSYVDDEYILPAMAVNNSVRGIFGFLASFIGSSILSNIQSAGNTFCGMNVNGQQVLCAISALLTVTALIFNKKVVSKQVEEKK